MKTALNVLITIVSICACLVVIAQPDPWVKMIVCGAFGVRAVVWFLKGVGRI
jgi:uncharacterized MnhB-related membrane protein